MNTQVKKLHQSLGNTVRELSERLGRSSNVEEAETILREMEDVNFRVMKTGNLLFRQTTDHIDKRIDDLVAANAEVDKAIKSVEKTKDIIGAIGKYLAKVDNVLSAILKLAV